MASAPQLPASALAPAGRARQLPALGLPPSRERRKGWAVASLLLHVLLIAALVTPVALHTGDVKEIAQGAGGPGPAGGGGGGRGGTGGDVVEHLQFVQTAPQQTVPVPAPQPAVTPPQPVVPPPTVPKLDETPRLESQLPSTKLAAVASVIPGIGGGPGHDGTGGAGPGTGGGVGSGVGPGRGSGIGPGTGGGTQANYPPSPTELFIPPLPMPDKVRGFHLVAEYDIDETGKILDFKFTPTRDRDYNKRLDEVLRSFRFRPGTRPDGTPIRMKAQIVYDF